MGRPLFLQYGNVELALFEKVWHAESTALTLRAPLLFALDKFVFDAISFVPANCSTREQLIVRVCSEPLPQSKKRPRV